MKTLKLGGLLALLLLPTLAPAQVSLGLRAGYGLPHGEAFDSSGFGGTVGQSGLASGQLPLQVDASWRFGRSLSAGLYLGYAFGRTGARLRDLCSSPGASCDTPSFLRYGAGVAYAFSRGDRVDPWIGLTGGLQSTSFAMRNFAQSSGSAIPLVDVTYRGWEVGVEGGLDHRFDEARLAGVFLAYGVGQYTVQDIKLSDGPGIGGGVTTPHWHEWITLGLRGRYDLTF